MSDRYDTSHTLEAQFQPGSDGKVLANKLGIIDPNEMDEIELGLLDDLTVALLEEIAADQKITTLDLCEWHRRWLGNVFAWAGRYRTVNLGKDGFQFAAAHLIPKLMEEFEEKYLKPFTPCGGMDGEQLAMALATVHVEYILIHPFREGNGRLGRLLATIMALQADWPPLNFTYLLENRDKYIQAIHAGLDDMKPMQLVFRRVLQQSASPDDAG